MIEKIKILLGLTGNEKDNLLRVLLETAIDEAKGYCGTDTIDGLESTIMQMTVIKYNLMGHEGLSSESYSGASYSYMSNYPQSIISALQKKRRLNVY